MGLGWGGLLLLSFGLAMDAFAVAVCKGLALGRITLGHMLIVGLWFGVFQGLMPALGYFLGSALESVICALGPWISFGLLSLIGANMIRHSLCARPETASASLSFFSMLILALATSMDALAAGISLACSNTVFTFFSALMIGSITLTLSCLGVKAGSVFGSQYQSRAECLGGAVLILLGVRVLLQHVS